VIYNPLTRDHDAYYHGRYIGSNSDSTQAWVELDRLAREPTHDEPAIDPMAPFAIGALPLSSLPITDDELRAAHARFCAVFTSQPRLLERAAKALEIALARDSLISLVSPAEISVRGSGARPYRVRLEAAGQTCSCRDFWISGRQAVHSGSCKHIIAIELLRMAQAAQPEATSVAPLAFVTLPGQLLGLALGIARLTAQAVRFGIKHQQLSIAAGDSVLHCVTLQCPDGAGDAAIRLAPEALRAIWTAFKPVATSLASVDLLLDQESGVVALSAAGFAVQAVGRPCQPAAPLCPAPA
jgi:hypothetical protein